MITIRDATVEDLPTLLYWDKQDHVIEATDDSDWNWKEELRRRPEWREQLIAELNGTPIGFLQIIDPEQEETHYWGDVEPNKRAIDIWIGEKENLNKGYGTQMMRLALEKCFENPEVTQVLIDPLETNDKAIRFYQRIGFRFIEKRLFEDVVSDIYAMSREMWLAGKWKLG